MSAAPRGPYGTEAEALTEPAVREVYAAMRATPGTGAGQDGAEKIMLRACDAAGVALGAYDAGILRWLAGFEPQACAAIAGIIARAAGGNAQPALCWCGHLERAHNAVLQSGGCGFCTECAPGRCGRYEAARPGQAADAEEPDAAAQLAEIRLVLEAFDWERDDRQYALEQIDDIVNRGGSRG